jgi:hypothetical protein
MTLGREMNLCNHLQEVKELLNKHGISLYHEDPGASVTLICPHHKEQVWIDDLVEGPQQ